MKNTKILYTATSDIHLKTFHLPYLKLLKRQGAEIHLAYEKRDEGSFKAASEEYQLVFKRNPFALKNISTLWKLYRIIKDNKYDIIHCHTPVPAVLTRVASFSSRIFNGTTVIYTAHGYHFFKNAPLKYWMLYFPVEFILSAITDAIVLINKEDYDFTRKHFFNKQTYYLKGIGVDKKKFDRISSDKTRELRLKLSYQPSDFILLYTAEFIPRKNHQFIIQSVPLLASKIANLKIIFAGVGRLFQDMQDLSKELNIERYIDFLGWRNDIERLAQIADIGISSSKQEGLGIGLTELMFCGKPIVATEDRGHREMVENGVNGYLYPQGDKKTFIKCVTELYKNKDLQKKMGMEAYRKSDVFLISNSVEKMKKIYFNNGL